MNLVKKLSEVLANTYALYLKTQNYHWNVCGKNFFSLHQLFEVQYKEMAEGIDAIAEITRTLEVKVPASFEVFENNSVITSGEEDMDSISMIEDLFNSQKALSKLLEEALNVAQETGKQAIADLIIDRMRAHDKNTWMLASLLVE